VTHHYEGDDLIVRKIRLGPMDNNVYVLECPRTHDSVIVDASFDADAIVRGARGTNVTAIWMTHNHRDHVDALPALSSRLGAPVLGHPADDYPVPTTPVQDGEELRFGEVRVRVLHTPGHTPGGICFLTGTHLFSGDSLFPGGPGNTRGDAQAFTQLMDAIEAKLFTLPDDTAVYPGHGEDTTVGAEKPHAAEWRARGW
jgi:glyoxylase-like metal-dependent hydrolase (beta-lactamase superfamily II)